MWTLRSCVQQERLNMQSQAIVWPPCLKRYTLAGEHWIVCACMGVCGEHTNCACVYYMYYRLELTKLRNTKKMFHCGPQLATLYICIHRSRGRGY